MWNNVVSWDIIINRYPVLQPKPVYNIPYSRLRLGPAAECVHELRYLYKRKQNMYWLRIGFNDFFQKLYVIENMYFNSLSWKQ